MNIEYTLAALAKSYPQGLVVTEISEIPRIAHKIRMALNGADPKGLSVCDIGGGFDMFATGCAELGMKATVIDDFSDIWHWKASGGEIHKKHGVTAISRDVIKDGVGVIPERFDIVTTFDCIEHLHHSPKALLRQIREDMLKPGGRFVLGVPNCVNLRKRLTAPFGNYKWSSMETWYEETPFRGHVREPDVEDLLYIARDMKLKDVEICGRNWLGYNSHFPLVRLLTPIADHALRLFPTLCSDIYLTGHV